MNTPLSILKIKFKIISKKNLKTKSSEKYEKLFDFNNEKLDTLNYKRKKCKLFIPIILNRK